MFTSWRRRRTDGATAAAGASEAPSSGDAQWDASHPAYMRYVGDGSSEDDEDGFCDDMDDAAEVNRVKEGGGKVEGGAPGVDDDRRVGLDALASVEVVDPSDRR